MKEPSVFTFPCGYYLAKGVRANLRAFCAALSWAISLQMLCAVIIFDIVGAMALMFLARRALTRGLSEQDLGRGLSFERT